MQYYNVNILIACSKKIVIIGMGYIGITVSQKKIQNTNVNIFNP